MPASAPVAAQPDGSTADGPPVTDTRCDVCPHALADHDPIGLRFCRATRSAGAERGCVCV